MITLSNQCVGRDSPKWLCRTNPSAEGGWRQSKAGEPERQIPGGFGRCGTFMDHHLLYTMSRNGQLSLFFYQLVNLSLESYIRHFDLKYVRDEFCPSCLQSGQLRSKRGLSSV